MFVIGESSRLHMSSTHNANSLSISSMIECSKGYFGADCSQQCHGCTSDECDPFSGTCLQGCEAGISCRKAFFLPTEAGPKPPVATITARHDGYTASWSDSGAIYFLSQEMLHQLSCIPNNTKRQQQHAPPTLLDTPAYSASNLLPHTSYNVCVVASSPEGLSLPWCTNVTTLTKECSKGYLVQTVVSGAMDAPGMSVIHSLTPVCRDVRQASAAERLMWADEASFLTLRIFEKLKKLLRQPTSVTLDKSRGSVMAMMWICLCRTWQTRY
ncbi:hypothetical protein GWK47_030524 [Chionoecetes opilio]|uniref:Fibronectin type-III domain-containing protein n=1 Tax=Chionoecetes opilio TaxID=41210 RepID=A0A8J4YK17_CHIOP|nr:hypothetical protein GWK47_030524 [Chionoecetes opilio]